MYLFHLSSPPLPSPSLSPPPSLPPFFSTGPVDTTIVDFWRMIWQLHSPTIVMTTNLDEGRKKKCERYWPEFGTAEYGPYSVALTEQQILADYTIRKLTVTVSRARSSSNIFPLSSWLFLSESLVWCPHSFQPFFFYFYLLVAFLLLCFIPSPLNLFHLIFFPPSYTLCSPPIAVVMSTTSPTASSRPGQTTRCQTMWLRC